MSKKLSDKNKVILACAGSGKTTDIVEEALKFNDKRVLLITYTNENLDQIKAFLIEKGGCIPANVTVQSWFTFLLQDCVRPYQNHKTERGRVRSIYYYDVSKDKTLLEKLRYIKENTDSHYLTRNNHLYEDKVSKFICKCDDQSNGLVVKRLEKIYDCILIDEAQDLEGWDYDLIGSLFDSSISIILVGDPRQKILKTHRHLKNKSYDSVFDWLEANKNNDYVLKLKRESWRCNQIICDFADKLFPDLPQSVSNNTCSTEHDGIFYIPNNEVENYISTHKPAILRYSKKTDTLGYHSINIGLSKGRTYERILIFPTKPMLDYLKTKDISKAGDKSKLYVAVTRAKNSVAFVVDNESLVENN